MLACADLTSQNLANTSWSFALSSILKHMATQSCGTVFLNRLQNAASQHLANPAWCYRYLVSSEAAAFGIPIAIAEELLPEFHSPSFTNIVWAFATQNL